MAFSDELKKRRMTLGLSMRDVQKKTDVSASSICRYERGTGLYEMGIDHILDLSRLLGWELSDMVKKLGREIRKNEKAEN